MFAILTVLIIVTLSLVVTRVATVALTLTGLSRESARFQARSALTGTGYATSESERIVRHPVRRRIVMSLMLIGSAGVVSVIASLVISFAAAAGARDLTARLVFLLAGLLLLYLAASSRWLDRALEPLMTRLLRRLTDIDVRDYAALLHIYGDFAVSELAVEDHDWLANRRLEELRLADEGLLVLGVERDATTYLGAPTGRTRIHAGDVLIVYGSTKRLAELDQRPEGDLGQRAHSAAAAEAQVERRRSADPLQVAADGDGTRQLPEEEQLTRPLPEDAGEPR